MPKLDGAGDESLEIVSGGQTGVDQGALDAALARGVACGGWCPEGRLSESGTIPARYPVRELAGAGYADRTRQNVVDSDGTVLIFNGVLEGGTQLTAEVCHQVGKPLLLIDAAASSTSQSRVEIERFVRASGISVLNVAGPRASKWPEAQARTRAILEELLSDRSWLAGTRRGPCHVE